MTIALTLLGTPAPATSQDRMELAAAGGIALGAVLGAVAWAALIYALVPH